MDPYTRARTVRIGKWRWPPPKEEMDSALGGAEGAEVGEGFFEFKMRKMQERKLSQERAQLQQQQFQDQRDGGGAAAAAAADVAGGARQEDRARRRSSKSRERGR